MRKLTGMMVFALMVTTAGVFGQLPAPEVKTDTGMVTGKMEGSVRAFLGIP